MLPFNWASKPKCTLEQRRKWDHLKLLRITTHHYLIKAVLKFKEITRVSMQFYAAKIRKWTHFKYHSFLFNFRPCGIILLRVLGLTWYSPGSGRGNPSAKVPKHPKDSIGNSNIRMLENCHFIIQHVYI